MTTLLIDTSVAYKLPGQQEITIPAQPNETEVLQWIEKYLGASTQEEPDPALWDMRQFCLYLESLGPEALVGIASMPLSCPLRLWRAGRVEAVWGFSYLEASSGLRHTLPPRAQLFVAWLDLHYPHQPVTVKQALPIAQHCANLTEAMVPHLLDQVRSLIWRR